MPRTLRAARVRGALQPCTGIPTYSVHYPLWPAESVKKPSTPLSLRVSGHLLLGLSRIYAKKVGYLATDATEMIAKNKTVRGACGAAGYWFA